MTDPTPTPQPAPDPTPDSAPTPGDPPTPAPTDPPKSFSEADLNRIVQERLARQKAQFGDVEALKAKAAKLDEIEAKSKSDLEREQEARVKAEQERDAALQRANDRLIQAEILAAASKHKALKPEHLHRLIDKDAVTIGDDGQVTGAEEAVKAFLEANPEYVGGRAQGSADQGARGSAAANQLTHDDVKKMDSAEIVKAQADGRLATLLAGDA